MRAIDVFGVLVNLFWGVGSFYFQIPKPLLKINHVKIKNRDLVVFKTREKEEWRWMSDECPHMGASLSKGWTDDTKLFCPYHGFGFSGHKENILQIDNDFYLQLWEDKVINQSTLFPYYPPEHFDKKFVFTGGSLIIPKSQSIVTENVLDMLHISYVHSFGNMGDPLPRKIEFQSIDNVSGRTVFVYHPFEWTISHQMGRVEEVVVENEFHLPTTTITRVKAGNVIKTVMTRATPISENKTLFFYRVYRNFWNPERFPFLRVVGDCVMDLLMKMTLKEDLRILETVYDNRGKGILTPYDITIDQYRKKLQEGFKDKRE